VHAVVLMAPTLVLAGFDGISWAVGCFAIGIIAAAMLESYFVSHDVRASDATVQDPTAIYVARLVGLFLLAIFWSAQIEQLGRDPRWLVIHAAGAALLILGIVLRVEAIRALGPRFVSDIRCDDMLVRDGIYGWLRHPSEIGLLAIAIGGPLLIGSPVSASVAAMFLVPISLWRMRREDVVLVG
jgi:protein-S-isoprenylcysteine O-methyltransferase Ste14